MELVYLWVEKYKNIYHQGFNFSPRFEFDYDENAKKLTNVRDDSKTYKSIFPDNINITAIVGENGSGKSSVFEILSKILVLDNDFKEFKYFYILNNGSENICYSNNMEVITELTVNKHIPMSVENSKIKDGKSDYIVALNKHFDVNYLNISHLEKEGIIKNDSSSPEDPIKYYGIYAKNDIHTPEYGKTTLKQNYSQFSLSQFNFLQTYAISQLLIDDKYEKLLFGIFKINKPHSIKLSYSIEELKKPHKGTTKELIAFLKKLQNDVIELTSENMNEFFQKCSNNYDIENDIKLIFQTNDGKNIKFSTGEKTILFYLQRIDLMLTQLSNKSTILLFDEIELYLHPNWQKRILKIIIDFISSNKLTNLLHIIINSHSPFILSDLPKENVIFLENGEQKDPFKDKQTFGANIHTLLSDGFFMSDGLMGEFAKGKIEEIKKFYDLIQKLKSRIKSNTKSKKVAKHSFNRRRERFNSIQSIIGEPFLKTIMKNYLDELEFLFLDDETLIDKELEVLEERKKYLKSLKK